jgi:hypothetical protein
MRTRRRERRGRLDKSLGNLTARPFALSLFCGAGLGLILIYVAVVAHKSRSRMSVVQE